MTTWWVTGRDENFRPLTADIKQMNEDIEELFTPEAQQRG